MKTGPIARAPTPAVLPAAAFVFGAWLAPAPGCASVIAAGTAVTAVLVLLRPAQRRALLVGLCLLAGLALGGAREAEGRRPLRGWIDAEGDAVEGHVVGRVLRAAEKGDDGAWHFRAAVRPEPDPAPGAPEAVVRFTVVPGRDDAPPEVLARLRAGDRVRVWSRIRRASRPGNPGQSDPRTLLASRGEHATGWVKSALLLEVTRAGAATPRRLLDDLLVWTRGRLDRALGASGDARALAGAMVLGDRQGVRPEVEGVLRASGLAHLMAVSGLHVGIVCLLLLLPTHALRRQPFVSASFLGTAILAFAALTGNAAPVTRAAIMVLLALAARVAGRSADLRNSLALAAAALVAIHPPWTAHAGFRLSVGAVAGIATLAPLLMGRSWAPPVLRGPFAISASAYAATAPLLAREFHRVSPSGLVTNPPAVALGVLLVGGAMASAAFVDLPGLGPACASITILASRLLLSLASAAAAAPGGSLRVSAPGALTWALHLASWGALAFLSGRRPMARRLATAGLLAGVAAVHLGPSPGRGREPHASILDVGQGQAVVLWGSAGTCVVVDAGGGAGGRFDTGDRLVAPLLLDGGCRRVDIFALTHAHDDHAGGAAALLRDLDVGELWVPVGSVRDGGMQLPLEAARSRGVAVRLVGRGSTARAAGWRVEAIHPSRADFRLALNDRGLALTARSPAGASIVVAGDLEREGERRVLGAGAPSHAHALVAGHHGARNSNSQAWIAAIAPRTVVISAGTGNRFGHPHPEALARLTSGGAAVYRTDRDGQVRLIPDSASWRVETTVPRAGAAPE